MESLLKIICAFGFLFYSIALSAQNEVADTSLATADTLSRAERLLEEGNALRLGGEWQKGLDKFEPALMMFLEEGNMAGFEKVSQYIVQCAVRTKKDTLESYLKDKVVLCEEYLGTNHVQTAIWYGYFGKLYSDYLDQFDLAQEYLQKALNIFRKKEEKPLQIVQINTDLAFIQINLADYAKAEEILNNSAEELNIFFDKKLISETEFEKYLAIHYSSFGLINREKGLLEEAIPYYNKSIELNTKYNALHQLAIDYYDVGLIYLRLRAPLKAEGYLQNAVSSLKKQYGEQHPTVATVYGLIGNLHSELSEFEKAIEYFEKAVDIKILNFGEKHATVGITYYSLARTWYRLHNIVKAEQFFQKTKVIYEERFPDPNPNKINLYQTLSYLWAHQKTKLDSAQILLEMSVTDAKAIYGDRNTAVAGSFRTLAFLFAQKEEFDTALLYIQKALVANSYQFNSIDFAEYPTVSDFIDDSEGLSSLNRKAYILKELWNKDKNNEAIISQIRTCSGLGNLLVNEMTKSAEGQLQISKHLHSNVNNAGKLAIADNFDFYQYTKRPEFIEQYLFWMEKLKAQQLSLTFQNAEARNFAKIPNKLIETEQSFLNQIDSLEQLLFAAFEANDSSSVDKIQNESLFELKREQEEFIAGLEKNYPDYYQLKYDLQSVKLPELKQSLNENELFLEYFIDEKEAPDSNELFFLALSNGEEQIFKIDLPRDYSKKITTFNKLLRSHNLLRADRRRKFINLSHELYNQFIQPIEHLLEGKDRLVIVGEGVTHYLPFGVLLKSNEDKPWHELDFLIRDHEISYHYSGTLFARAQASEQEFENELLAFAPIFSEGDNALASLREGGLMMTDSTFRSVEGDNFSPLPHSEKEVKNISQLFPKSSNVNMLMNENANETNLKSALEQNHRFVHIASHSFANIDYPNFSGIACAESDSGNKKDDGILYVGEIYNLAVNSDLVVLSSCESGVGKLSGGEGMLGLNRSFVYSGVPNVIFSLWKVYDEATGKMMTEFYKNTLNGDSYSKALRAAKLKMLENPTTATPDIWGAFLLVGR